MRRACIVGALCLASGTAVSQEGPVPAQPRGVTADTRRAIERGVRFLVREQAKDGSWRSGGGYGSYPVAMTGLAGLALVSAGSTPVRGPHAKQVRRAVSYLLSKQQPNGLIAAPAEEPRTMYSHGFSVLFLAQVYGMEEDATRQQRLKTALRRAIALIGRSQSRDGGWLYTPDAQGDEGSVTITQVQALRACRNAGLHVPKQVIDKAVRYIERSQRSDGGIAYRVRSRRSRPALTAAACAVLYNAGTYDSNVAHRCFDYAWRHCQPTQSRGGHWFYTQLYMSQAVWQKGDKYWLRYYPDVQRSLLRLQQGNGSWQGDRTGLVYGTAIALLILQIPYNRLPILSR